MDPNLIEPNRPQIAKFILIILPILFIALVGFLLLRHRGKLAIEIKTAPKQAVVAINGEAAGNKVWLAPGDHQIHVSYDGFSSYESAFTVAEDSPQTLAVALTPRTSAAKQLAQEQASAYLAVEAVGSLKAQAASEAFVQEFPIAGKLPYRAGFYNIDYGKDADGNYEVQISAHQPVGRQVALAQIRSWGFDPTDYNIKFVGFQNRFGAPR